MRWILALLPVTAWAQMAGMDMSAKSGMGMADMNPAGMQQMNFASGTSQNPLSWPMPMAMYHYGHWNFMFMANAFLVDTQQSGPRGADKLYSANWLMASASHRVGAKGSFDTELMLSLEPATVTSRRYPLLFQTGETAYGQHLVDAQHPHNFVMGLGFRYTHEIADQTFVTLYAAPVGDPALGPPAFPHRASAMEIPQAALSHHWQDSTHIAYEVVTAGISHKQFRLEASGFHGKEPGEDRWTIESGAIDSWSGRVWYLPSKNWVAQFSGGRIAQPEGHGGDQIRLTSSVEYTRPIGDSAWSTSLIWGRNHDTSTKRNLNAYLIESVVPVGAKNFITGRAEMVDKDELFAEQPAIEAALEATAGSSFRIGSYTVGYTRDFALWNALQTGIGFNVSTYSLPSAIKPYYGDHPVGGSVFLRVRLKGHHDR